MISAAKYVWVGSILVNKLTLWCLLETVKSVFSKDLKNTGAKWKRRCSPKDLWSGILCLVGQHREQCGSCSERSQEVV